MTYDRGSAASTRRILVLLAHPPIDRSEVNRPMAEAIDGLEGVTLIDPKDTRSVHGYA